MVFASLAGLSRQGGTGRERTLMIMIVMISYDLLFKISLDHNHHNYQRSFSSFKKDAPAHLSTIFAA